MRRTKCRTGGRWTQPGKTYKAKNGQSYLVAEDGSLRRTNPNPTKAERKAIKRDRRRCSEQRRNTINYEDAQNHNQPPASIPERALEYALSRSSQAEGSDQARSVGPDGGEMTTNQMPTKEELDRNCAFTFGHHVRRMGTVTPLGGLCPMGGYSARITAVFVTFRWSRLRERSATLNFAWPGSNMPSLTPRQEVTENGIEATTTHVPLSQPRRHRSMSCLECTGESVGELQHRIRQEVWAQVLGSGLKEIILNPIGRSFSKPKMLTGTRYGKKALDPDNLIGSLKPVIDALVWAEF